MFIAVDGDHRIVGFGETEEVVRRATRDAEYTGELRMIPATEALVHAVLKDSTVKWRVGQDGVAATE